MLNVKDILATQDMIDKRHLDIRTITMGISLLDCADPDVKVCARKIYDKITRNAENLVKVGQEIEWEFGIPIVNKRISVTPMAIVGNSCNTDSYVPLAIAMATGRQIMQGIHPLRDGSVFAVHAAENGLKPQMVNVFWYRHAV